MTDFEMLFDKNHNFIFRYLMNLCKDTYLAEELTQETFFRAYMNIGNLKHEERASAWLCRIAKNTYFAWYNEHKKLSALNDDELANNTMSVEDLFAEKELSDKALVCLHQLEEPYKEVFMLSVFGGLQYKDISKIFGKSESWARVTFYRARQKLLERMR